MKQAQNLKNKAIVLTSAKLFESLVQIATPMVLVRYIDADIFGVYRHLWLVINMIMSIVPLGVPQALQYFLPKSDFEEKNIYVAQTILFLLLASIISAILLTKNGIFTPHGLDSVFDKSVFLIPLFVFFWIFTCLLDFLPNAIEKNYQQAFFIITVTVVRSVLIIGAAVFFGDLYYIILAFACSTLIKLLFLFYFTVRNFDLKFGTIRPLLLKTHLRYAIPFGLTSAVYGLRKQGEQFIVSYLFTPALFGSFSLATMATLPFEIIRTSISNVLLPKMVIAHYNNDVLSTVNYSKCANILLTSTIYPVLVYVIFFSVDIVQTLFGINYLDAAPVLRIYMLQLFVTLELGTIIKVYALGRFDLKNNIFVLIFTLIASLFLSNLTGLIGAAIASALAGLLRTTFILIKISRKLNIPILALQNWKRLLAVFIISWLSIVPVYFITEYFNSYHLLIRLLIFFILQAIFYIAILSSFGEFKRIKLLLNTHLK